MAINSTVFKFNLSISDVNRGYYHDHSMTVARHPSETDMRMVVRLVAFALNAHEDLQFTKGLADVDVPDLWQKSLTGEIIHWIDLGQPLEKRIRQSCSKAELVSIYTYQKSSSTIWFEEIKNKVSRFEHLRIIHLKFLDESAVKRMISRTMKLDCLIQDNQILLTSDAEGLTVEFEAAY